MEPRALSVAGREWGKSWHGSGRRGRKGIEQVERPSGAPDRSSVYSGAGSSYG